MTTVSDDFNRADAGTLGANWTVLGASLDLIHISSNQCAGVSTNGFEYYSAASPSTGDQIATMTLVTCSSVSDTGMGPAVRCATTGGGQGYFIQGNTVETRLYRLAGGTGFTQRGTDMPASANGDVWDIIVTGSGTSTQIVCKQNGTTRLTFTDNDGSALAASGNVGMWGGGSAAARGDTWSGGDYSAAGPSGSGGAAVMQRRGRIILPQRFGRR